MSNSSQEPWSSNPNAPQIPYELYFWEKTILAGGLVGSILYGIVIVLFFQCMSALFDPANRRREGTKWGLIIYTVLMFSFVTIYTGTVSEILSISFVDNREFPGVGDKAPSGPIGYKFFIHPKAITVVSSLMFLLNNWLADGLLLYRCYVIYAMNLWAIAFPCFTYLGSLVTGIMVIYKTSQPNSEILPSPILVDFSLSYLWISLSLNVLLTLMIVIRLVLHSRNIRIAMGAPSGFTGLYKTVITMLIESSAIYTASSLLFLGPWGSGNHIADMFLSILAEIQVIAPLLIIRRVADQSALMSKSVTTGNISSINFRSRGRTTGGSGIASDKYPVNPVGRYGRSSNELDIWVETMIDLRQDSTKV